MKYCFLLILVIAAGGCGYGRADAQGNPTGYQWRSLYRQDVASIAIPIFTNRDFHRGIEFDLTKALINHLEANTPYKVMPRDRADTILEGEIVAVRINTLSQDPGTSLPQEQMMTLTVNFVWKDLRTGRILLQRRDFDQTATYYPTLGEGRFTGSQHAVERLALGIVQELQADW